MNRRGPNTLPCGTPETIGIHSLVAPSTTTLPAVGEELPTKGQHTTTCTNRLQFKLETIVTHSIEGSTKVDLNNTEVHPASEDF